MTSVLEWKSLLRSYPESFNGTDQNKSGLLDITEASHLTETNLIPCCLDGHGSEFKLFAFIYKQPSLLSPAGISG